MAAAPLRVAHLTRLRVVSRRVMLGQDMLGINDRCIPGGAAVGFGSHA